MDRIKVFIKQHKKVLLIAVIIVAIAFLWRFFDTFSEEVTDSAWDGVVATELSGTGTVANPYVISDASEYGLFKNLLEGDNASIYADKNYVIASGFNYGEYDMSIDNEIPFSGTIDGGGHLIYNATITDGLFKSLENATIKNINLNQITYTLDEETGALLANSITNSNIEMVIIAGNATVDSESSFGGFVYLSSESEYKNIVLYYDITSESENIYKFAYELDDDTGSNILVNEDNYDNTGNETDIVINSFEIIGGSVNLGDLEDLDEYKSDDYEIIINNNQFLIQSIIIPEPENNDNNSNNDDNNTPNNDNNNVPKRGGAKAPNRSPVASDTITEHASGASGTTFYINDLVADYNYMKGLNFTEIRSTSIPSGTSTGYYDDENLVKVEIIYDAKDINNNSLVGALSPLNNETTNKFVYFKYYALARNSDGTLATNSDGDNYIEIELIDNPFSKRPYVNPTEYGFNGWVCNQSEDTTANLCENSKFRFRKSDYTRYMEIPVEGESELIIHLNANWYRANVITSYSNISNTFTDMQMNFAGYTTTTQESRPAIAVWNQNYATMVYTRNYVRGDDLDGYMPAGSWYKYDPNGTSYTYNRNRTRCARNRTCYGYTSNTSGIVGGTEYTGGSVKFVPNYNATGTNNETTINSYNTNYMHLEEDPNGSYTMQVTLTHYHSYMSDGDYMAGFFYQVNNPSATDIATGKYYTANGTLCTSASSCTTAYKLIHYNDEMTNSNGNSIATLETVNGEIVDAQYYYYLVTRDLQILRHTSSNNNGLTMSYLASSHPFTLTGTAVNATTAAGLLNTTGTLTVGGDLVIENIRVYGYSGTGSNNTSLGGNTRTSYSIYANSHNLKLGRNLVSSRGTNYLMGYTVMGGTNNAGPSGTFRVILESGLFYAYHSGAMSGSNNYTLNETTIFGNDYDRINNTNNKFKLLIGIDGYAGGHHTAGSDSLFASFNIIKSGSFGYNPNGSANTDNTAGMYIGGRASTCVNSITGAKIEGGNINIAVGGYGYNGSTTTNSTYIGMSGGTIRSIYGGAGHSTTKGNRIINVTGGTVSYSILGGSDSYNSGSTDDGIVQGSTLVYVGGNVTVGGGSGTVQGVESGSVFGAGGGDTSSAQKGTVYNSHVIINGGTIMTSVYGGGNHGSTGTQSTTSASTVIDIYAGNIGSVYGGSKSAGFSISNQQTASTIDINVTGGTIGNLYGGSNTEGDVYGSVDIDITGGTVTGNVYGGGQGASTTVKHNVDITIGDSNGGPTINGNVYGGSAMGTVNRNGGGSVTVTVEDGVIHGSVFGGGQGDANNTPYVLGPIEVIINDGDITSVFGGNDQAGSHTLSNEIYLNGGVVGTVYGGGNRSSVTNTNIYLDGSDVTTIYGGSNAAGTVSTTNIDITSGSVHDVYGGNNSGGTCGSTDIDVDGTAQVTGTIYGGGNQVATTTTVVNLESANGTIPYVYGGGRSASVTTTNVTDDGVDVGTIFGGSNSGGTVTTSNVHLISGTIGEIYGGNNANGNTVTANIDIDGGTIDTVYGGGYSASGGTSSIDISGGTVNYEVFGGGNSAGLTSSTIVATGGTLCDIYGGSNTTGTVNSTSITVTNVSVCDIYGGGNRAQVGATSVVVNTGTIADNVYGGGNLAQVTGNTSVDINAGTFYGSIFGGGNLAQVGGSTTVDIDGGAISVNVYGGGNDAAIVGSTTVTITDATIAGSVYAGGNGLNATVQGNTSITIDGNTTVGTQNSTPPASGSVFGGGNKAVTGTQANNNSTTHVNIVGGTFYGNVYGGANTSVIYGNTIVNIGQIAYTSNNLTKTPIHIYGSVFGGGEANASGSPTYDWDFISVTLGTNITIDADTYNSFLIDGSFFGGGNASSATGDSYLTIRNYGSGVTPKRNVSIQRVTYVTLDNSSILLAGATDRANDYDTELFAISRVDDFIIQNGTYIFLETGANLLMNFQSLDSNGDPAEVEIDNATNTITRRTVDNRVYMYEGRNLNIAQDQQVTVYGDVTGMTFFGIFNFASGDVNTGIYNPTYTPGANLPWGGVFSKGSYVLGKHKTNHDITVDGFYSNFLEVVDEVNQIAINQIAYIDPTPKDSDFYMWYIGENLIEYNVDLVASKYSTLGSLEVSFIEFTRANTSFEVESFDISDIASGISLVPKNNIPRIAATQNDANTIFGLAMEASNTGWLTTGKTNFYTTSPFFNGTTYYEGENSTIVPTMLFYLYHSKNISQESDLGTVRITIKAITKVSALSSEVEMLVINVNMSTALFQTNEYEAAMTPGDKYELFTSTSTNITNKSKFSAYFGLYADGQNVYQTGYHRTLTSSYVFPENTKITMIDFGTGTTEYYYHVITAADEAAAQAEFDLQNECSYDLSMFTKMGSLSSTSNYNDAAKNAIYYDGTASSEEFIFIVDFGDTEIDDDQLNNQLLIEMRDANDVPKISVLGIQHSQMVYSIYEGRDSTINATITPSANPLYIGYTDTFTTTINYQNSSLSGIAITDTQYFDEKLGVQIAIKNANGRVVSGTDLTGAYFLMDGKRYYPDIAGYTHIKLADKVGNTQKWLVFNVENASLATGSYTFTFDIFASADGIYYSSGTSSYINIPINIINSTYGLNPQLDENSVIFDADNDKALIANVRYTSLLSNPNIRLAMYRRQYDTVYDTDYDLVDLQDYAASTLATTNNQKEYLLSNSPAATNTFAIPLNDTLLTGTYRLSFRLYDSNTMIGEINRYIVIK